MRVNHGEIVMRIGIARRQLDRATKRRFGRSAQPLSSKHNSEILKGVGVLRIELGGLAQRVKRLIILYLADFQSCAAIGTRRAPLLRRR